MSATAAQIGRLRRMVSEPTTEVYSEEDLAAYIEGYPLLDERGEEPYGYSSTTSVPTRVVNAAWLPTYDLNAAAADIWTEKAAALASDFDFGADGATYQRSQPHAHAVNMATHYGRKRSARTITQRPEPEARNPRWVVNAAEED